MHTSYSSMDMHAHASIAHIVSAKHAVVSLSHAGEKCFDTKTGLTTLHNKLFILISLAPARAMRAVHPRAGTGKSARMTPPGLVYYAYSSVLRVFWDKGFTTSGLMFKMYAHFSVSLADSQGTEGSARDQTRDQGSLRTLTRDQSRYGGIPGPWSDSRAIEQWCATCCSARCKARATGRAPSWPSVVR